MPIASILATVAAYVVIAVLLLSLNLASRWQWWIKGVAIVVTGAFFVFTFLAINALLGWPSSAQPPERFNVVHTHIVEPDNFTGDEGAIYLWVEELDEDNFIIGQPRSYRLPYIEEVADVVEEAQDMLDNGEEVQGETQPPPEDEGEAREGQEPGERGAGGEGQTYYPVEFTLIFNDLPAVNLPDKGAL